MSRPIQRLVLVAGMLLSLLALGFVVFAASASRAGNAERFQADGIVVLTGGAARIREGARLLEDGVGKRLLISGVNPKAGREDLLRLTALSPARFDCCVDVGYRAHDTIGNAGETRTWAQNRRFSRLVVVTASYHMPRSLAELGRALPGVTLMAHPVVPPNLNLASWWLQRGSARLLLSEYIKYIPAIARLAVTRVIGDTPGVGTANGQPVGSEAAQVIE